MAMVKATAPWPFAPTPARVGPAEGELVEVWFLPSARVEVDGKQMVRVQPAAMPSLEWWAEVGTVEILPIEPD